MGRVGEISTSESVSSDSAATLTCPAPLTGAGRLTPRPYAAGADVDASQRERLQAAMIETVGAEGYHGASVDRIVGRAEVSTKTLYRHFGSKLGCFLETYDLVTALAAQRIARACRRNGAEGARAGDGEGGEGSPQERADRLRGALRELLALVAAKPDYARLALVEVLEVGPQALPHMQRVEARAGGTIAGVLFGEARDPVALPSTSAESSAAPSPDSAESLTIRETSPMPLLGLAIAHGIWHVLRTRIAEGRASELPGLLEPLLAWALCYVHPEAERLPKPAPRAPAANERSLLSPDGDERDRALLAAAEIAARYERPAENLLTIAAHAGVEIDAVLDAFESPRDCYLEAVQALAASLRDRALAQAGRQEDFPQSACAAVEALLHGLSEDEVCAKACFTAILATGPAGVACRAALLASYAKALTGQPGFTPLQAEATVGAVWGLIHHNVVKGEARRLHTLFCEVAYLALAPALGAQRAAQSIREWVAR